MKNSIFYIALLSVLFMSCGNVAEDSKEEHVPENENSSIAEEEVITSNNYDDNELTDEVYAIDTVEFDNAINSEENSELVVVQSEPIDNEENDYETHPISKVEIAEPVIIDNPVLVDTVWSHGLWNQLLKSNVDVNGNVDYKGFKASLPTLQVYLQKLSENVPNTSQSKNEKLAFWINAYNAFTVKLIVDNYPLESITELDKPWVTKFIKLGGKSHSLGDIENEILRKMNEPRIHFAINCASVSCPKILNKAFTESNMSSLLNKTTKDFLKDQSKNDFSSGAKISKIFEWYASDFNNGDIISFINEHRDVQLASDVSLDYLEYDWSLND